MLHGVLDLAGQRVQRTSCPLTFQSLVSTRVARELVMSEKEEKIQQTQTNSPACTPRLRSEALRLLVECLDRSLPSVTWSQGLKINTARDTQTQHSKASWPPDAQELALTALLHFLKITEALNFMFIVWFSPLSLSTFFLLLTMMK